jgi:hypothetical protein
MATTLLKIVLNCDRFISLDFAKFEKSNYLARIAENSLKDTKLNVKFNFINLTPLHTQKLQFYFCTETNENKLFSLNQTSGNIHLSQAILDRETQYSYVFNVCALINDTKLLQTTLTILVEDLNDNPPEMLTFNGGASSIQLNLPLNHIRRQFNANAYRPKRLLQLSAVDKDAHLNGQIYFQLENSDDQNIFSLNRSNGWLSLWPTNVASMHRLTITAWDMGKPEQLKSKELNLFVNFVDDDEIQSEFQIDIAFTSLKANLVVFNLRLYFPDIYQFLALSHHDDYVAYNASNGNVYLTKLDINPHRSCCCIDVKLISKKSDLSIARLNLNILLDTDQIRSESNDKEQKIIMETFEIMLSMRTPCDTVIFKLVNGERKALEFVHIDEDSSYASYFYIKESMVLLKRNLTFLKSFTEMVNLIFFFKTIQNAFGIILKSPLKKIKNPGNFCIFDNIDP